MPRPTLPLTLLLAVTLLFGPCHRLPPSPVVAATLATPAEEYFKVRESAKVITGVPLEELQTMPESFTGKLVEIRGRIEALAGTDRQAAVLLSVDGQLKPVLVTSPPDKRPSDWPFLDVGISIRVLCQVVRIGGESGSLQIVIPVKESDAVNFEQRLNPPGPGGKKTEKAPEPSTPRGRLSTQDLIQIYGNALRYFNKKLSNSDSQFLASRIIDESRKKGLDARLFVAVVAVEGTLERTLFLDRGVYLGNQTARTAMAKTGTDLSRRVSRTKPGNRRSGGTLGRALASRRRDLSGGKTLSRAVVEEYVNDILRLYAQMSGVEVSESHVFYSEAPNYEARWRARRWGRPSASLVGTWETATSSLIAVLNANGSGVFGSNGEDAGRWYVSGSYLEFRTPGYQPLRFKWQISDDRQALTLVRIAPDSTPIRTLTMLRR